MSVGTLASKEDFVIKMNKCIRYIVPTEYHNKIVVLAGSRSSESGYRVFREYTSYNDAIKLLHPNLDFLLYAPKSIMGDNIPEKMIGMILQYS